MAIFLDLQRDAIGGTIATFDRLIFKGHLNALFPQGAFKRYLDRRDILLKDAGAFFEAETARLKAHAKALADDSGRPFVYLNAAHTHATGTSKESLARRIAEDDGVTEGLVCAFSSLQPCRSFTVAGNRETKRLEVVRRPRRCLHFYWYLIDPEFGWMHVRLQSWAPYSIQVYVNGREWLARQLDRRGIASSKSDNKITWVADFDAACQESIRNRGRCSGGWADCLLNCSKNPGDMANRRPAFTGPDYPAIAVGNAIAGIPPHRSERAPFGHSAPTSGV